MHTFANTFFFFFSTATWSCHWLASTNAPSTIHLLTTSGPFAPETFASPRGPDTTRQRGAKGGTSRHLTVACLTNCCQHAEMRGEGSDPTVRLKFTPPHRCEDRHVTTPPNEKRKRDEGRNQSGKMGGDRM